MVNGYLVAYAGINSLIVTLGGMVILQGLILVVLPPEFTVSVAGTPFAKIASTVVPAGTSYALAAAGLVDRPRTSGEFVGAGEPGEVGAVVDDEPGAGLLGHLVARRDRLQVVQGPAALRKLPSFERPGDPGTVSRSQLVDQARIIGPAREQLA